MVSRGSGERALESHSRPLLALSLASICNPFILNRPVTLSARRTPPPPAYLARPVVSSVGVPARHRQTRGLSQSITEDLTAPLKKNLPRTERTDRRGRTRARWCGRRARRPMGAPLSRRAGPIGEVIRKIGKKKCAIRTNAEGRTRRRTRRVMDRKRDCFPSRAPFPFPFSQMRVNQQT